MYQQNNVVGTEANIATTIINYVKHTFNKNALTVQDIQKIADTNIEYHKSIVECYEKFQNPKDLVFLVTKFRRGIENDKYGIIEIYDSLISSYSNKTKNMEQTKPFSPIYHANKTMISILKEIKDNASIVFEDGLVNINNCKISGAMALGILKQSDILADYSCILWTEMINLATDAPTSTLKYKIKFLNDRLKVMGYIVDDICQRTNRYSFLATVDELRKKNNDLLLYSNGETFDKYLPIKGFVDNRGIPWGEWAKIGVIAISIGSTIAMGLARINPIALVAGKLDKHQYNRYIKRKNLHEWMVGYTALLKYELEQKDPTSPEYQKLRKIISAYESKLVEVEQKINKYEEELL